MHTFIDLLTRKECMPIAQCYSSVSNKQHTWNRCSHTKRNGPQTAKKNMEWNRRFWTENNTESLPSSCCCNPAWLDTSLHSSRSLWGSFQDTKTQSSVPHLYRTWCKRIQQSTGHLLAGWCSSMYAEGALVWRIKKAIQFSLYLCFIQNSRLFIHLDSEREKNHDSL